jgi:Fe-Mn family superoxide dismutase
MYAKLPDLPYAFDALEPYIDAKTMEIHHDKHHDTYVNNLNAAIEKHPELSDHSLVDLLSDLNSVPEDIRAAIRNSGGGHYNHSLFWMVMSANGNAELGGELAEAINSSFGGFVSFKEEFEKAAITRFGSGWAWLSRDNDGRLVVSSSANQDTPLSDGQAPILCLDVWEHAYYLKYQNRRAEYVSNWWNVVNWEEVTRLFESAK